MARCAVIAFLANLCVGSCSLAAHNFLASSLDSVLSDLHESLRDLLSVAHHGGNADVEQRLSKIESSIARTYQALPKNTVGRLAPRPVRHLVHSYFAKEHGWQIQGLEPHGMRTNASELFETGILQDKSPALVEQLVEAHQSDRGLDIADVAAMIVMLERLVLDESTNLLHVAYYLNGVSASEQLDHSELHEILRSYLLLVEMGVRGNHEDIELHQEIKARVAAFGKGWPTLVEFENEAVMFYDYSTKHLTNPFDRELFSFEMAARMADDLAQGYGKWQNAECSRMKDDLMAMDVDGSGLIPLSTFYIRSDKREYQFTESEEYLREISAIDDSWHVEPRVRIANYVAGPSNCIASSKYYSVCCLNECDGLLNELEGSIKAPAASPERVVDLVSNLTSSSMLAPKAVSREMRSKLHWIAERNHGEVPLHGRLFAQWLHHAFPYECPFPHLSEDGSELTAQHWLGGKAIASVEKRANHVEIVDERLMSDPVEELQPTESLYWSEEEVLPLLDRERSGVTISLRVVVQAAMFLVILRIVLGSCSAAASFGRSDTMKKESKVIEMLV